MGECEGEAGAAGGLNEDILMTQPERKNPPDQPRALYEPLFGRNLASLPEDASNNKQVLKVY